MVFSKELSKLLSDIAELNEFKKHITKKKDLKKITLMMFYRYLFFLDNTESDFESFEVMDTFKKVFQDEIIADVFSTGMDLGAEAIAKLNIVESFNNLAIELDLGIKI